MKKYAITFILCVLTGLCLGKIMFEQYEKDETKQVSVISETAYFFQTGVYSTEENMKKATSNLDQFITVKQDKYYVYVGITLENKDKLKGYFENLGYITYVKEINITNQEFYEKLKNYDLLLKQASTNEEIKAVNTSILKTYKELINDD